MCFGCVYHSQMGWGLSLLLPIIAIKGSPSRKQGFGASISLVTLPRFQRGDDLIGWLCIFFLNQPKWYNVVKNRLTHKLRRLVSRSQMTRMSNQMLIFHLVKIFDLGNFLTVQWLGLNTSTAQGLGFIPGWGTKILQVKQHGPPKKKKTFDSVHIYWVLMCQVWGSQG